MPRSLDIAMAESNASENPVLRGSTSGDSLDEKGELSDEQAEPTGRLQRLTNFLLRFGIETHGIAPTKPEARTDKRLHQLYFVWFSANFGILTFSVASSGPAFFGLGLRDSLLIILFVDLILYTLPAYFASFGPKLGTRTMVHARYSWGYYGVIIPSTLNAISMQGLLIVNCIIGGQTLSGVSPKLDDTLGIVIAGLISFVVCFGGYKVVHRFESLSWVPNFIILPIMLGVGGRHLNPISIMRAETTSPKPAAILSYMTLMMSSIIPWCTMTADYGVFHDGKASSVKIFIYTYLGFVSGGVPAHMLGATFAAAARSVPAWDAGFKNGTNIGGLVSAVLAPAGGFGKFLVVVLALCVSSASALTMYAVVTSFMAITPRFAKVPRYIYVIISAAVLIPVAIVGASRFYSVLVYITSVIGYWLSSFVAIILMEHVVFRKRRYGNYDVGDYDNPRRLPPGWAAVLAFLAAIGIIIPSMAHSWYTGPIARKGTGDIAVLVGFSMTAVVYVILRGLEKRLHPIPEREVQELKDLDHAPPDTLAS
ncbi:hypothetical protein AX17_001491 [Amanita inopinata Kibby_2008]|nr:hypothetical protein AX17_001491 [Amanita inopinata Kibby_2008]